MTDSNYSPDYRLVTEVWLTCPNCGNPDCAEAEEFKAKIIKLQCERTRLERSVIEKAKEEYKVEREADRGANTITRTDALIKLQPLIQRRREAVAALLEFEEKQK